MDGMTTYHNHYTFPQPYNFPFILTEWGSVAPNIYPMPVMPGSVVSPQIITPMLCTGPLVTEPTVPIVPTVAFDVTPICNKLCNNAYGLQAYSEKSTSTGLSENTQYIEDASLQGEIEANVDVSKGVKHNINSIEFYLRLPKELFPTPRMLSIDPNLVIDEFCKLEIIKENVSWILDLEFGLPRGPVTRAIATYDVKFNSIHCKNTPGAIHPGFEKCNSDFKRAMLFYYDCVVSNWYNGYIILNNDKSVENFQSWLQIPMRIFGMCWP